MSLNARERYILHITALMVMEHFGSELELKGLPEFVRKNRARSLTKDQTKNITEEIFEEMIFSKVIYEEYENANL